MSAYEIAASVCVSVSAIVVAAVAVGGLNAWWKELRGRARFELSRKLIVQCRRTQADFEWARFPVSSSEEHRERPRLQDESPETARVLDQKWTRWQRVRPLIEHLRELQELTWESEAVLDANASAKVAEVYTLLRQKYAHLTSGIEEYFSYLLDEAKGLDIDRQQEFVTELKKDIYGTLSDEFQQEIESSIGDLASLLKQYLQ